MTRTIKVLKFIAAFGWGGTERQFVNLGRRSSDGQRTVESSNAIQCACS